MCALTVIVSESFLTEREGRTTSGQTDGRTDGQHYFISCFFYEEDAGVN